MELLRAQGAEVRVVEIPDDGNGEKVGADDYIARRGLYEFLASGAREHPEIVLRRCAGSPI